jgi:hypothetical protein
MAGNTIYEMMKERTIPALIIHPRLITGRIPEKSSDEKPAIVVIMAKNVGVALESIVSSTTLLFEALGYFERNSSYLTMR